MREANLDYTDFEYVHVPKVIADPENVIEVDGVIYGKLPTIDHTHRFVRKSDGVVRGVTDLVLVAEDIDQDEAIRRAFEGA